MMGAIRFWAFCLTIMTERIDLTDGISACDGFALPTAIKVASYGDPRNGGTEGNR